MIREFAPALVAGGAVRLNYCPLVVGLGQGSGSSGGSVWPSADVGLLGHGWSPVGSSNVEQAKSYQQPLNL